MSKKGWFTDWFNSTYYHALYQHRDETEALLFIDNLLLLLKPNPHATMLDIACGKGRHSSALFDAGFDVTGIDLSPASIGLASEMETNGLAFYCHDMREIFKKNYFDFAFNFFTSFGYFDSDEAHQQAITAMSANLKEGGTLVLDYLNVGILDSNKNVTSVSQADAYTFYIKKWQDALYCYKEIKVEETISGIVKGTYQERVRKYNLSNFEVFMQNAGLHITDTFGNYALENYASNASDRLIIIARKQSNS